MFWSSKPDPPTSTTSTVSGQPAAPRPLPVVTLAGSPPAVGDVDPAGFFRLYGAPVPIHDIETHKEFVSSYDRRLRCPNWVIEHLTAATKNTKVADRSRSLFAEDTVIPAMFRAKLGDYFRSGYDRGHQAPAADARWSQAAMDQTFLLTNIAPQVGEGFNRDYWAHFERFARQLTDKYASVRIITGPLFLPHRDRDNKYRVSYEVIGDPPNIAVPTHFFKIIIGEDPILPSLPRNGVAVGAFVLPNEAIPNSVPLEAFKVPVNAIERAAGVEFFSKLPEAQRRELCREVNCAINVVEFDNAGKRLLSGAGSNVPAPARSGSVPGSSRPRPT